jgi:hypothetical protein
LYDGLFKSKFCGRSNRGGVFRNSLKTIAQIESPIVCYTSERELPGLVKEFSDMGNIEFRSKELDSYYFHQDVNNIRDSNPDHYRNSHVWMFRCVEIMWGKFLKIKDIIKDSPDLDHIYWIDAGLSHSGIIHSRFNPHYSHNVNFIMDLQPNTLDLSAKNDLIFNSDFTKNLVKFTGNDGILNIVNNNLQHQRISPDHPFKGSVVGGLFGGNVELMNDYCDAVISLFEKYTNEGSLYKEEQIMTQLLNEGEFPLTEYRFDTWYHPDWDRGYYSNYNFISFCDFFDEINPRR